MVAERTILEPEPESEMENRKSLVLLICLTVVLVGAWWWRLTPEPKKKFQFGQMSIEEFNPRIAVPVSLPAIVEPESVDVVEATRLLSESELVLGVVVGGEPRAYPINMLNGPSREIINDKLGGQAIAATW